MSREYSKTEWKELLENRSYDDPPDGYVKEGVSLIKRLQALKSLLGIDAPEMRGWASAVQQESQKVVNAAISEIQEMQEIIDVLRPLAGEAAMWRDHVKATREHNLSIRAEWIDKLAKQYGARQHAALRGDQKTYEAADNWMRLIASDHWHEIIAALQRPPLSEEQPHGTTVNP